MVWSYNDREDRYEITGNHHRAVIQGRKDDYGEYGFVYWLSRIYQQGVMVADFSTFYDTAYDAHKAFKTSYPHLPEFKLNKDKIIKGD